ncbi:TIM barrel protein [candidate division KSB1 bacterium]|nr:TIM barrel protein [candidate division KSB1 bacterium]
MKLAIVSDQISTDFREAVEYGLEWGIEDFELRNMTTGRVPYVTSEELEQIIDVKEEYGINVSAISPGLFRISLKEEEQLKLELEEKIYDSFRFADKLGTKDVIIFSFKRYPNEPQSNYIQIVHILGRMTSLAEKYGFRLLLENDIDYWCQTGEDTAQILEEINSKSLRANWDPANAYAAGEIPYPYGFLAIRKYVASIHVKDAIRSMNDNIDWVMVGQGEVDWKGQFQAIMHGIDLKYVTIETSCKPVLEYSRRNILQINNMVDDYILDDNYMIR